MFPTGVHVEFDVTKPPGSRVRSLSIICTKCRVPHYEPVEDEMVYTVVMPSYLVTGGDGYSMIQDEMLKHNSGETFRCVPQSCSNTPESIQQLMDLMTSCSPDSGVMGQSPLQHAGGSLSGDKNFHLVSYFRGLRHLSCVQIHHTEDAGLPSC